MGREQGEAYGSLRTHVEGLGGVIGPICEGKRWLRCSESVFSNRRSGEGDLLEIGYVVLLGV